MKFTHITLLILIILSSHLLLAKSYYLSNSGNDQAIGTSPTQAWRTIQQLNTHIGSLGGGDTVLFRRGDVFRGTIYLTESGSTGIPLVFAAYGEGNRPIISGTEPLTNWQMYNSRIWYTLVDSSVYQLFEGNNLLTLARFPNDGLLTLDEVVDGRELVDSDLNQAAGHWGGANIRLRTSNYTWEYSQVADFEAGGRLRLAEDVGARANWGYYLDNKFEAMDQDYEWYYDRGSKRLYVYLPAEANPNLMQFEASIYEYGIKGNWNRSNIHIKDLHFDKQFEAAIWLLGYPSRNNLIQNSYFSNQGKDAIEVMGENIDIVDNEFVNSLGRGIFAYQVRGGRIANNKFKHIGYVPGLGINGVGGMIGIFIDRSEQLYVGYNQLDSIGYNGMTCNTANSLVERNIVKNTLLLLDDGAAIYCWGGSVHHTSFKNNFVYNIVGNNLGIPDSGLLVFGIYLDNKVYEIDVDSNTVVNSNGSGILVNADAHDNRIRHNVVYNSRLASFEIAEWLTTDMTRNMVVTDNVFFALDEKATCVSLRSSYQQHDQLADFDRNYYHNPYSTHIIERGSFHNTPTFSYDQWQAQVPGINQNSKTNNYFWDKYQVINRVSENLIYNGDFSNNDEGWTAWPGGENSQGYRVENVGLDEGAYYFEMLNGSPEQNGYPISRNIPGGLDANKYYEFSFSVKSDQLGTVTVIPRRNESPYNSLGGEKLFAYRTSRADYHNVFQVDLTESTCRLDFKISYDHDRKFFMDNIELYEVEVSYQDPTQKARLFTNETAHNLEVLLDQTYLNLDGQEVSGSIKLAPYSSVILLSSNDTNPTFPVELISFNAQWEEDEVMLTWETATESNNSHFTIEKSIDGRIYVPLGLIDSKGNSQSIQEYHLLDHEPFKTTTFYRLKQTDLDGSFSYLGIVEINTISGAAPKVTVFPNPVMDGRLHISLNHLELEKIKSVALMDLQGRVVYQMSGIQKHSHINLGRNLSDGMYWLVVHYDLGLLQKPIVIMSVD